MNGGKTENKKPFLVGLAKESTCEKSALLYATTMKTVFFVALGTIVFNSGDVFSTWGNTHWLRGGRKTSDT